MKRIFAVLLALSLVLALSACGGKETPAPDTENPPADDKPAVEYPTKSIDMIVPYAAGGSADTIARAFAAEYEQALGVSIVVTNMAGATGSIGGEHVLDADADGYTILFSAESPGVWQTTGVSEHSYADFTPITMLCNDPKVIVVSSKSPYQTMEDLVEAIKANPGKIKMSHSGPGGSGHIQGLMFANVGLDVAMTPFNGSNDALLAVMGGQVDYTNAGLSTVLSYVESGDLRILATFSNERADALPDVPAVTETVPELTDYVEMPLTPQSVLVKKGTPDEVVEVLRSAATTVLSSDTWNTYVENNMLEKCYEQYTTEDEIEGFYQKWTSVISYLLYDAGASANDPSQFGIERWS